MKRLYLGIDGGGTGSRLALVDENRQMVAEARGVGVNIHSIGADLARENLRAGLDALLQAANIQAGDITALCLGSAGLGREADKALWAGVLRGLGFTCPVSLVTDSETALYGGLGKGVGVAVISGTGSIAIGYGEDGAFDRSGGWGHIIGDEGSGYDIGRQIIATVAKAQDGMAPPTALTALTLDFLGISDISSLVPKVYGYTDKKDVAALAVLLQKGLDAGDEAAEGIARRAAGSLAALAVSVCGKLRFANGPDITTGGSVLEHNAYIRELFAAEVAAALPKARLRAPLAPPVIGAALIALSGGLCITDDC